MSGPEVSVVLATRNSGPWLRECLSSILDDQDVDLEVVAVDDGSTDDTWRILTETAAHDRRLHVRRSPGRGRAQARRYGVGLARAPYLAFSRGDDLVPRRAYARMLASARDNGADMVVGSVLVFSATGTRRSDAGRSASDVPRSGLTLRDEPGLVRDQTCGSRLLRATLWDGRSDLPVTEALCRARTINVIDAIVRLVRCPPGTTHTAVPARDAAGLVRCLARARGALELTGALDDAPLRAAHEAQYLESDGIDALRAFLRGPELLNSSREELAAVGGELGALDGVLTPGARQALVWPRRWMLELALAGRWADARWLADVPDDSRDLGVVAELLHRARDGIEEQAVRELAEDVFLSRYWRRREPGTAGLAALRRAGPVLRALLPAPVAVGPAARQHLLGAVHAADDDLVARVLEEAPPRFTLRRVVTAAPGEVLVVNHRGAQAAQWELFLRRDDATVPLPQVGSGGARPLRVALPDRVGRGEWELWVRARIDGLPVVAPVGLARRAPTEVCVPGRLLRLGRRPVAAGEGAVVTIEPDRALLHRVAGRWRSRARNSS